MHFRKAGGALSPRRGRANLLRQIMRDRENMLFSRGGRNGKTMGFPGVRSLTASAHEVYCYILGLIVFKY